MTYRYEIKGDRLYLYCVCDSTLAFAYTMKRIMECLKFIDIQISGKELEKDDEKIPKDKKWCNYEFECSGVFPNKEVREKFDKNSGLVTFG